MTGRRVVVTGLGIVSPVGSSVAKAWDNILNGVSGIRPIDAFDASKFPAQICGNVIDFNVDDYIPAKEQKKMDRFIHFGIGAAVQAIKDAGLEATEENAERIGVAIGSGIGGLPGIQATHEAYLKADGPRRISPFFVPACIINMVAGDLAIMYGYKGPNVSLVSACATGNHNIGFAARSIVYGDADVMIAGGAEMTTTTISVGSFANAKALTPFFNDCPERASRPWDKDRSGFVLGEGAGVVVLEEYEHAKKRGAKIYCEVAGYALNGDAHHMTQPAPGGEGAARCMKLALRDAKMNINEIEYINAHGTSTPAGDKAETDAAKSVFGDHAYKLAMSSTKSMTGHLLGAAGGIEAVFSVLAMRDQVLPPTINYETPDPECDLDYVPNQARKATIKGAMSNSFGFGGTNATLIFRTI